MAFSLSFLNPGAGKAAKGKTPAGPRPWTPADIRELKTLFAKGTPIRAISLKLGRSEGAVQAKIKEEGLAAGSA